MKKSDVLYVLSCTFISFFSLAYSSAMLFHIKLPRYYPLEHAWKMGKEKGVPSQGWYGMWAFALIVGAVITFLFYLAVRSRVSRGEPLSPRFLKWIGALSLLIVLVCMVYVALHEFSEWGIV